jgi:hypothetical protein
MNSIIETTPPHFGFEGRLFYVQQTNIMKSRKMFMFPSSLSKPLEIGFLFSTRGGNESFIFDTYPAYSGAKHNLLCGTIKINGSD